MSKQGNEYRLKLFCGILNSYAILLQHENCEFGREKKKCKFSFHYVGENISSISFVYHRKELRHNMKNAGNEHKSGVETVCRCA